MNRGHVRRPAATSAGRRRRSSTRRPRRRPSTTRNGSRSTTTRRARSATASTSPGRGSCSTRTTAPTPSRRSSSPRRATAARRSRRRSRSPATSSTARDRARSSGRTARSTCSGTAPRGSRRAELDVRGQVDRRRRDLEQAGRDRAAERDRATSQDTAFRVNSYPAAAAAPNGDLYATWTTETEDGAVAVYSKSTDGGATWTAPARVFAAATRTPVGYPVTQPSRRHARRAGPAGAGRGRLPGGGDRARTGGSYFAPTGRRRLALADLRRWTAAARGPDQLRQLGDYIHNTRLDYMVTDLTTNVRSRQHASDQHPQRVRRRVLRRLHRHRRRLGQRLPRLLDRQQQQADRRLVLRLPVRADADQPGGRRRLERQLLGLSMHRAGLAHRARGRLP